MSPNSPNSDREDKRWPRRVYAEGTEPDPRFSFANERTFLAWIRTGLGFLAAGVAVAAIGQYDQRLGLEVTVASVALIICGVVSGLGAFGRWMQNERALRLNQPLPSSGLIPFITAGLVVIALIAFFMVSFR